MGAQYADVIIDITHEKLDKSFSYRVPERLVGSVDVGSCVLVPFGRGDGLRKGYVVALHEESTYDESRIKEIVGPAPRENHVMERQVALAAWLRRQYGGTMIQALRTVLPARQTVGKVRHRTIERTMEPEELISLLGACERKKQTAKARLLRELLTQSPIPYEWISGKLGISAQTVNSLEKAGALRVVSFEGYRNPVHIEAHAEQEKTLSDEQQAIVDEVLAHFDAGEPDVSLLYGITGSGKTEVYMQLIAGMIERGRQAIVLIPEIALTYQTLLRFYRRFGDRVSVMNSTLSAGEKYDQCERAKNGELDVIIGPRSALFTPFPRLGLIVIDEEQEQAYKSEGTPKYHARETAVHLAAECSASVVLGSATPSLEAYSRALLGEYRLYRLTRRLTGGTLPTVETVDLRTELRDGNRSIFSRSLQEKLRERLERGEQSMLFLNRRGYAGFVSCRACGLVMKCPHCDVSLSQHQGGRLICHYCGYTTPMPHGCPSCGSKYLLGFRAGTQQIEEKLAELFPTARLLRMDADTTRSKDSYDRILSTFANGEADILIGTQMIVKGHDFPNVTLVGVLAADLSLGASDYRAAERTFQLLTQAVGRAGRGTRPGEAILQTYQPEHYAVLCAAKQDYEAFYEEEILYRELSGYPPAAHLLAVWIYGRDAEGVKALASSLADVVKLGVSFAKEGVQVLGPAPAVMGKVNDIYRYVFYIKHAQYERLVAVKDILEEELLGCPNRRESVQFDFDPMTTG